MMLMIAERTKDGILNSEDREMIKKMEEELAEVIEDFMRAVDIEALCLAKKSGKHALDYLERACSQCYCTEQDLLLKQLEPVKTNYHQDRRCMEGTREYILNRTIAWVSNSEEGSGTSGVNTYWVYGSPGIGKTSLAHSICGKLHDQHHLAGAFFCRRDDPKLSEPRNILPTLICKLARMFPPFRRIVADRLRNDPNMTPESMKESLFVDFFHSLPRHPNHALVFVIDALDECGDSRSRLGILKGLTNAAAQAPWLKIIITSRPEVDIQRFFDAPTLPLHFRYDLATDQEASTDLRTFARTQFDSVASRWYLSVPWPEESLFKKVISRANGLFIFVNTVVLALENCPDPTESLEATLQGSSMTGMNSLYGLYSSILSVKIVHSHAAFRQVIGVLLATASHRTLCEETIAALAGVSPNLVKKWVDDLSSLLCRDEGTNGGIRVRHLSISEFFLSNDCHSDFRINLEDSNTHLGISCLKTMVGQLRFNICKLEDSRLANADVKDLASRIKKNVTDALQYSTLYWSNHLCFTPYKGDLGLQGSLKKFFEGLYPLFWLEVLSILRMVPIGAPSIRRAIAWLEVSKAASLLS